MSFLILGASAENSSDPVARLRVFGVRFGELVEAREKTPGAGFSWTTHPHPASRFGCVATVPNVALVDNTNTMRQLRVFFGSSSGNLMAARFPAGSATPQFDNHSVGTNAPPGVLTAPGALMVDYGSVLPSPRNLARTGSGVSVPYAPNPSFICLWEAPTAICTNTPLTTTLCRGLITGFPAAVSMSH